MFSSEASFLLSSSFFFFFDEDENAFESIKHINEYGQEYWYARELQKVLEYTEWRKFKKIAQTSPITETMIMVITFALTVIFDLVVAIAVGMALTGLLFVARKLKKAKQ